ncbi:MFS transporter [Actinokineospora globicatena]|uniref:MFS transporter n=1 Tax=Actinokineospora globicatena TaxID=103729 RepID=UPI0020A4BF52|nr:MFS transporter [Actinokineospora globicatena]MCP2306739.1 putative arabinose efflux permease, MFS family [Actinokineospora globicatena]
MSTASTPPRQVLTPELAVLTFCQFLYYGGLAVDLTLTALVGLHLAPSTALATVPFTVMAAVAVVASYFAGTLSARHGHRAILIAGALAATAGGLVSMWAVIAHSFPLLCVGTACVGLYKATGGYFRYLAADRAPEGGRTRALSTVLLGGVAAALVGPWAATWSGGLFGTQYAGSYLLVAVLAFAVVVLVLFVRAHPGGEAGEPQWKAPIGIREASGATTFRTAMVLLGAASGLMTLLMTMGPIAGAHHDHTAGDGALIIQWHMVGMFAPALVSGRLVTRWGAARCAALGAATLAAGGITSALDDSVTGYTVGLCLVGVAWNLLYVSGSQYTIRSYPPGRGGRVQGAIEAAAGGITVLASLVSAEIFRSLGWTGANVVVAVISGLLLVWTLTALRD